MPTTYLAVSTNTITATAYGLPIASATSKLYVATMAATYKTADIFITSSAPKLPFSTSPIAGKYTRIAVPMSVSYTSISADAVASENGSFSLTGSVFPHPIGTDGFATPECTGIHSHS